MGGIGPAEGKKNTLIRELCSLAQAKSQNVSCFFFSFVQVISAGHCEAWLFSRSHVSNSPTTTTDFTLSQRFEPLHRQPDILKSQNPPGNSLSVSLWVVKGVPLQINGKITKKRNKSQNSTHLVMKTLVVWDRWHLSNCPPKPRLLLTNPVGLCPGEGEGEGVIVCYKLSWFGSNKMSCISWKVCLRTDSHRTTEKLVFFRIHTALSSSFFEMLRFTSLRLSI